HRRNAEDAVGRRRCSFRDVPQPEAIGVDQFAIRYNAKDQTGHVFLLGKSLKDLIDLWKYCHQFLCDHGTLFCLCALQDVSFICSTPQPIMRSLAIPKFCWLEAQWIVRIKMCLESFEVDVAKP